MFWENERVEVTFTAVDMFDNNVFKLVRLFASQIYYRVVTGSSGLHTVLAIATG